MWPARALSLNPGKREVFNIPSFARAFAVGNTPCGVCGWRDHDFLLGLIVCALAAPVIYRSGYNYFSDTLPGDTRAGACGGPLKRDALSIPSDDLSGKVYDC